MQNISDLLNAATMIDLVPERKLHLVNKYFGSYDGNNVLYLKGESNYTEIHMINEKKLLLAKTMKQLMDYLPNHQFLRIHKSYIINRSHAVLCSNNSQLNIKLDNGKILPISRAKKKEIKVEFSN